MDASRRFFLSVLLLSAPLAAGNLMGRVVDTAGNPVAGAQLRLEARGLVTSTDAQGRFLFAGVGVSRPGKPARACPVPRRLRGSS